MMEWLIVGLILGLGLYYLMAGSLSGKFRVRWYQWVLGVLAVIFFLLALQNYLALQEELEPTLAGYMWLFLGLPAVILAALIWLIPWAATALGKPASSKGAEASAK